jgi:TadE-like protein
MSQKLKSGRSGHAVLEVAFLAPWILFLFAGAFDMGFYAYAIICTENAARVGALHTRYSLASAGDTAGACQYALAEMAALPNMRNVSSCNSLPLIVTATSLVGIDGAQATSVSVTYQTVQLIPLPWLTGRLTLTRIAQMRI